MKRNAKFVVICLAAVFVLVLMCGVLVACNKNKDKGESGSITSVISNDDLEHIIGYIATEGYKDGQEADVYLVSQDLKAAMEDEYDAKLGARGMYVSISLYKSGDEDGTYNTMYILDGESQAKAYYDTLSEQAKAQARQEGKYIYAETEEGFFKNTVFKASLPSGFSKTRMDFIKDCAKLGGVGNYLSLDIATNYKDNDEDEGESYEYMSADLQYEGTNCTYSYGYSKIPEGQTAPTQEQITEMLKDCTSDSYVDTTKEAGYVFEKLIEKTGLFYDDATLYIDEAEVEGLEVDYYNYDKNSSKNLEIPAKVGEKNVIKAGLQYSNLETITLAEGILEMGDFDDNEELTTLSLPKSIKILYSYGCPFEYCSKLTTIKYAGTQAEWTALVEANNLDINERWCKYSAWDDAAQQSVQKTLSFTVQCSNGNISYPTAA